MPKKRARLQEKSSHMMDLRLDFDPGIRFEPEELHISPPTPEASTTECVSYLPMNDPFHFPSQTSFPSDDSPGLIYHTPDPEELFSSAVQSSIEDLGTVRTAEIILGNVDLRDTLIDMIHSDAHHQLKSFLKSSILCKSKKDKNYLLELTPEYLCNEMMENAPLTFNTLSKLLGITQNDVNESSDIRNVVAMMFSLLARLLNRKASGYAHLLTSEARDGGLREDSIKLMANFSHPRTVQKFDKEVLAKDWDSELLEALDYERTVFNSNLEAYKDHLQSELDSSSIPQIQPVWDNLNLRSKHRFERMTDNYADSNYDWMASLWIQERVNASHMKHEPGKALKQAEDLNIQDFVPSLPELNYIFTSLVHYHAKRLITRHPEMYKSSNSCTKVLRLPGSGIGFGAESLNGKVPQSVTPFGQNTYSYNTP